MEARTAEASIAKHKDYYDMINRMRLEEQAKSEKLLKLPNIRKPVPPDPYAVPWPDWMLKRPITRKPVPPVAPAQQQTGKRALSTPGVMDTGVAPATEPALRQPLGTAPKKK